MAAACLGFPWRPHSGDPPARRLTQPAGVPAAPEKPARARLLPSRVTCTARSLGGGQAQDCQDSREAALAESST